MKKRINVLTLTFIMIVSMVFSFNLNCKAAEQGESLETAYNVGTKGTVVKTWNAGNYQKKCYVKFNLKKNGYAQFKINKPSIEDGSNYYNVFIYNSKGKEVWAINLEEMGKEPGSNFSFKVGLKKGTYYADIRPAFNPDYEYEEDEDYILSVPEESLKRQVSSMYPLADVLERSSIMQYFDDDVSKRINQMWINIRCYDVRDIPVWGWVLLAVLGAGVAFLIIRNRKNR